MWTVDAAAYFLDFVFVLGMFSPCRKARRSDHHGGFLEGVVPALPPEPNDALSKQLSKWGTVESYGYRHVGAKRHGLLIQTFDIDASFNFFKM